MGAQHQIGRADGGPGEGVANALTHPVISINRKRQKHCDVFVGPIISYFHAALHLFCLSMFLTTAAKLGE